MEFASESLPGTSPLALSCRKIGPALTTGNVMVVKPPSVTPVAVMMLGELAKQAGVPDGVLNLVTGGGSTMGEELVTNPITQLVTMTGSTKTGQQIFRKAAERLTAVRLELGGKAAVYPVGRWRCRQSG